MTLFGLFSPSKNKKLENIKVLRDDVAWLDGFNLGFSKAWDMMVPLMTTGNQKMKEAIRNQAIDDTLDGLENVIVKRIDEAGLHNIKGINEVLAKRREFEMKLSSSKSDETKKKYENYVETLNWVIDGNILPKTK